MGGRRREKETYLLSSEGESLLISLIRVGDEGVVFEEGAFFWETPFVLGFGGSPLTAVFAVTRSELLGPAFNFTPFF